MTNLNPLITPTLASKTLTETQPIAGLSTADITSASLKCSSTVPMCQFAPTERPASHGTPPINSAPIPDRF
jgi:hypothetical protein